MDGNTIGTLAQYIAELRGRDRRDNNRADRLASPDTTTEDDDDWDKRNGRGDGGRDQHSQG